MKLKKIKSTAINQLKQMYYLKKYYNGKINDKLVLIESKQGEDLDGNMYYILKEISKFSYFISPSKFACKKFVSA